MTSEQAPIIDSEQRGIPRPELAGALQAAIGRFGRNGHELDFQQEEALEAIGHALLNGEDIGYVEMATSSGKTVVESLLADAAVAAGMRVIMLAPTKAVAEQIAGIDGRTGLGHFTLLREQGKVREHFGARRGSRTADAVVSTYVGFLNDFRNDHEKLGHFGLILADENHRSLGPEVSRAMTEAFPGAVKIGFSATPDYSVDRLSQETYKRKYYEFSLESAVESGKTAPVRALIYETDRELKLLDHVRDYSDRELAPLIMDSDRNAAALKLVEEFVESGRRGFVACVPGSNNLHARIMSDLIAQMPTKSGRQIRVADIGGHLSDSEVADRLKRFKAGELDVLTATRMLDEGVDIATLKFGINMVPSTSPVRITQLLGRLLRQDGYNTEAVFVDFVDRKTGIAKGQFTALHALNQLDFDMTRVIGDGDPLDRQMQKVQSQYVFGPEVYEMLAKSQGKTLQDIIMPRNTRSVFDALQLKWNRVLADEDLSEELPYNSVIGDRLANRVKMARLALRSTYGREPSIFDINDEVGTTRDRQAAIANYGIRLAWDDAAEDIALLPETDSDDSSLDEVAHYDLQDKLQSVFQTLSERESGVIKLRFGLTDGQPKTLDEIGQVYGVTRDRIRQIESKTMEKLRNPMRSQVLRDYLPNGESDGGVEYAALSPLRRYIYEPKDVSDTYHNYAHAVTNALFEHRLEDLYDIANNRDLDTMFELFKADRQMPVHEGMSNYQANRSVNAIYLLEDHISKLIGTDSGGNTRGGNNPFEQHRKAPILTNREREICRLALQMLYTLRSNRDWRENLVTIKV